MDSTIRMSVNSCIKEYDTIGKKIKELEKYRETLKTNLVDYLNKKGVNNLDNAEYVVKLSQLSRDVLSNKRVPKEIWNQYKETITYPKLTISKKKIVDVDHDKIKTRQKN